MHIEIFEWKPGQPRLRDKTNCLDALETSADCPIPRRGDIIRLQLPNVNEPSIANDWCTTPYVVLESELVWAPKSEVRRYWLYVRELSSSEYANPLPETIQP